MTKKKIDIKQIEKDAILEGAAKVEKDTSKDAHWDSNNPTPHQKAKMYSDTKTPEGNAPDAGMTPEEADKLLNKPKEQVTEINPDAVPSDNEVETNIGQSCEG